MSASSLSGERFCKCFDAAGNAWLVECGKAEEEARVAHVDAVDGYSRDVQASFPHARAELLAIKVDLAPSYTQVLALYISQHSSYVERHRSQVVILRVPSGHRASSWCLRIF